MKRRTKIILVCVIIYLIWITIAGHIWSGTPSNSDWRSICSSYDNATMRYYCEH
jgi:hypothetical protein